MTGQLIRVTTTPFQAVRFSQSARLVSSDSVDLERRKAIARMRAFQSKHSRGGQNLDMNYVNKINRTFSSSSASHATTPSPKSTPPASAGNALTGGATGSASSGIPVSGNSSYSSGAAASTALSGEAASVAPAALQGTASTQNTQEALSVETDSAYTMDRGAFEFRVATGDLSFLENSGWTSII